MDAAMRQRIRSALRKLWLWSAPAKEALKQAKAYKGFWFCKHCGFPTDKPQVDHLDPVGATPGSRKSNGGETWDGFMTRLFCAVEGLQVLCRACHALKTAGTLPPPQDADQHLRNIRSWSKVK